MSVKRSKKYIKPRRLLFWGLLLTLTFRSFVAPGYEFVNTDSHEGFSLGVVWCPGLNGLYSIPDDGNPDHDHERSSENSDGDHFTATCGLWTGNTSFVDNSFHIGPTLLDPGVEVYVTGRTLQVPSNFYQRNNPSRAPPVLAGI